jgi:hypothetical protein
VPELVKGYHTDPATGETKEYEMFKGDLRDACEKYPKEWSRTAGKSAGSKTAGKEAR